jgi:hypothetical protein
MEVAGITGVMEVAEKVFEVAQANTPTITGALKASGKITYMKDLMENDQFNAIINYGDSSMNPATGVPTSSYAVDRHERPSRSNPEGDKWLEKATMAHTEIFKSILVDKIRGAM